MDPAPTSVANVLPVNLNYLGESKRSPQAVLRATYVDGRQLKCWTWGPMDSEGGGKWQQRECNSGQSGDQVAISPDGRHMVTIEDRKKRTAVHRLSLPFLTDRERDFGSRLASKTLILWNTSDGSDSETNVWKKEHTDDSFNHFVAHSPSKDGIRVAALSPSGQQVVWVEPVNQQEDQKPKYEVRLFDTSNGSQKKVRDESSDRLWIAVNDKGLTAIATGNELRLSGDPIKFTERIVCLGFSPDNNNLVVGMEKGKLRLLKGSPPQGPDLERDQMLPPSPVTACAVANDGTIVGGFADGSVWVFKPGSSPKSVRLSSRAIYQLAVPVKAVSLEEKDQGKQPHHVAALWEWQANGCTRPGLPGQSVQIWELQHVWDGKPEEQPPPVSIMCFPNQRVTTIGSIRLIKDGGEIIDVQLPVVLGNQVKLIPCRGCARGDETATQILTRLKEEAKKLGAQDIDDKTLATVYGIRF
jgi:WD40 repeat protein